ncbi:MAG: OsmC family protein [Armatimonadetes bacterium]|nr:OsmC family protein [Armatimonadota bacterium]
MNISVSWTPGMRFDATAPEGTHFAMDAHREFGGSGAGPTPMETVLAALAGCTGMDVVSILKKMRAPLEALTIEVSAERAADHPKVFTAIHLRYRASGAGLQKEQVEKAANLSEERYCSVAAMLGQAARITYEVIVEGTATAA